MQFNFGTLINSLLVALIIFYVYFYPKIRRARGHDRRNNTIIKNPAVKPGDAQSCKDNRDKIIKLEESVENVKKDVEKVEKNNRIDHRLIFEKIDKLRN